MQYITLDNQTISNPDPWQLARFVAEEKFAWPGGYALFLVTDDGAALCRRCAKTDYERIAESIPGDGWYAVAYDHTGNDDGDPRCDNCYETLN